MSSNKKTCNPAHQELDATMRKYQSLGHVHQMAKSRFAASCSENP
jgi:hypothetical protein